MESAISQLKRNSNKLVYNALIRIRKQFIKEINGVSSLRELGGIKLLLYHIQKSEERIVDVALSILGNCCLEQETRQVVRELDGISFIVRNLENTKNESILNRSCRVLGNLAMDEINGDEIHKHKCTQMMFNVLSSTKDPNFLQSGLRTLRLLSTAPRHREIVIRHGGVECLGKLLVQSNSETPENVLMGILKAMSTLAIDSNSWAVWNCLKFEYVEALVGYISDERSAVQESTLHILSNLSKEESFRPILGNAALIPVLIKKANLWETSSPGWQWAVDCLCQCTREAVNRVRIRQEGGVEILIRLLKDEKDDRLWHRGLASIINFEYDETSFSLLVDLGMVEALIDKFIYMTSTEDQAEHKEVEEADDEPKMPIELTFPSQFKNGESKSDNSPIANVNNSRENSLKSHFECYSPENSPPYWTQFLPVSPPNHPSVGYSPGRSISPDRQEQVDQFCYSPVYEWDVSDDSDLELNSSKISDDHVIVGGELEEDASRTEATPIEDAELDENTKGNEISSRSPLGDILMIFSRLSLRENPTPLFLNSGNGAFFAILDYITKVKSVQSKSIRIVNRILRNPLCLEKIILFRIPSLIVRKFIKSNHPFGNCSTCSANLRWGESFLKELTVQAECFFGYGVFQHLIDGNTTLSEKISAVVAAALLISSLKGRRKVFIESCGLVILTRELNDVDELDRIELTNGLAIFSSRMRFYAIENEKKPENLCICKFSLVKNDEDECVKLCASGGEESICVDRKTLASKSEVFNVMLFGSFMESCQNVITIQNTCFSALKCLIHYLSSCRTNGCPVLQNAFYNEPVIVVCDIISLTDRFLLLEVKNCVIADIVDRHNIASYASSEITEIHNKTRLCNCNILEGWAVSHLLSDNYENYQQRLAAFNQFSSPDGLLTKDDLGTILMNELMKCENTSSCGTIIELKNKFF